MSFEVSGKTRSVLSVRATGRDLAWTFYIVEREGRRFLVPRSPQARERRNAELIRLQSEATAFATAEARRRNWVD